MSADVVPFGVVDYIIFGAMLAISAATGIYHCFAGGGQKSTSKFLVADGRMGCVPIAISIFVTYTSSIAILGYPAEVYIYGIQYAMDIIQFFWVYPFAAYFFVPVFRNLPITSVYEYVGMRYNLGLRIACTVIFILHNSMYMATTMVGPALAIEAVQGIEMWKTMVFAGVIATFYTTLGGIKAVIWADVFQFIIIFGSIVAVAVLGTNEVGGIEHVWNINKVDQRLNFFDFNLDISSRLSFFGLFLGAGIGSLGTPLSQATVQRYLSAKSLGHARGSLLLNLPFELVMFPIIFFNGLVLYAYYNNNQTPLVAAINSTDSSLPSGIPDTASVEPIRYAPNYDKADQILMYFISSQFGHIRGLQGLFVSCLFAGTLSTVSSGLNATVACILQDVIKPWRQWRSEKTKTQVQMNDAWDTKLSKIMSCVLGVFTTLFGFLVPHLGSFVEISNIFLGVFLGPVVGIFIMGMFFPRTNTWGVTIGLVISFSFGVFVAAGPIVAREFNMELLTIQKISFMWYATANFLVALIVGLLASEIARCVKPSLIEPVDKSLLVFALRPRHAGKSYDSTREPDVLPPTEFDDIQKSD
ncbi:sodium-dependent multivitamin transporter-like [Ptychodera flava]|uniref:sodium-dependent multivitamin transporter-like n=1 Tax=Ptychodera flava TaxID=63121 RepID=UPI00396A6E2E